MYALKWLVDHDVLPKTRLEEYYASYVADFFRTARFGAEDAHAQAGMVEFNYLVEHAALKRTPSGRYAIDFAKMPAALSDLTKELLQMEAAGDRAKAESWFTKYGAAPEELKVTLRAVSDLPLEIEPVFSFKQSVK